MGAFTIRIPDELDADVRRAAAGSGLSLNGHLVRALQRQLIKEASAAQAC